MSDYYAVHSTTGVTVEGTRRECIDWLCEQWHWPTDVVMRHRINATSPRIAVDLFDEAEGIYLGRVARIEDG